MHTTIMPQLPHVAVRAVQQPAEQALISLSLLGRELVLNQPSPLGWFVERPDESAEWITAATRMLSLEELTTNRLIFDQLADAVIPQHEFGSFVEYLEDLEATPASELAARIEQPHTEEAQALCADPPALKQLLITHLHQLWKRVLADEWRRAAPRLQYVTQSLLQREIPSRSAPTTIRAILGRDLPLDITAQLASIHTILIIPSMHVGIFIAQHSPANTLRLFVGWSIISSWALRQSPLRPAEIRARLAPLGDEHALKILDLLAQHGEQSAQELITALATSQSSVSRYLKSLGSYLVERRGEGANKHYQISYNHLDWTITMLRRFLEADQMRAHEPSQVVGPQRTSSIPVEVRSDLKRFSDAHGLLQAFPTRRSDQLMVLNYLIEHFEAGRMYTEREINECIRSLLSPQFDDFVTMRRELYNNGFLGRERDGSRYWRITPAH